MSRPKKAPEDVMDVRLPIQLTADQKEMVRQAAKLDGSSNVSEWARQILLHAARERIDARKRKR